MKVLSQFEGHRQAPRLRLLSERVLNTWNPNWILFRPQPCYDAVKLAESGASGLPIAVPGDRARHSKGQLLKP